MSIYRITPDDIELSTIVANPRKMFYSSSDGTITGTINLFSRHSDIEKEVRPLSFFENSFFNDEDLDQLLRLIKTKSLSSTNIESDIDFYLGKVKSQSISARKQKQFNILRFEPSFTFSKETQKKQLAINQLLPYYRESYDQNHFAYTNYHCLNFFTASGINNDAVLIYPNSASNANAVATSGTYALTGAFTFEFYINPKYTTDDVGGTFKAGTILHLSSSYAVSLITGSSLAKDGKSDGYRIQLQLSHSADISPSIASFGNYPNDLIFLSPDNSLKRNHWHHVAIRWGTELTNDGTGSFVIDGQEVSTFAIPSSTLAPEPFDLPKSNPSALCIGNFYEGLNEGTSSQDQFFSERASTRDGLVNMIPGSTQDAPIDFSFDHPLNAEVHDIRIYNSYRVGNNIELDLAKGASNLDGLAFYLPPFFTKESTFRRQVSDHGGVLQTPFFAIDSDTDDPFNVAMSFGVGGHYLNLENFLRDFSTGNYPRQMGLTGSQINDSTEAISANDFLYATESIRRRNVTLLPCDNGLFVPNFELLSSGTFSLEPATGSITSKFVNDLGILDYSLISLRDLVSTSSLFEGLIFQSGSVFENIAGPSPEDPGVAPAQVLTVFQRTRDNTSNEIVFFDISNLFYGNRLNPGSFKVTDTKISGTSDKVSITLKDNGYGSIYRADSLTNHAKWNSVGNIFYNEGLVMIKSPNIPFFGKEEYNMSFEGESTIHVMKVSAEAGANLVNSSSNPDYKLISASLNANDSDTEFVYITNIDFLDENFNVIMKSNLAQPILKRNGDKILFKSKIDI